MATEEIARMAKAMNGTNQCGTIVSDESAPVPPPTEQSSGNRAFWAQIQSRLEDIRSHVDVVLKTILALWNISLLLGGLIFIVYFASIGFMPEIDVTASVTLLAVSAITGAGLLIAVGLSLIAPSYVWIQWTIINSTLDPLWSDEKGKFSRLRAMLWFILPLLGFLTGTYSLYVFEKQWHIYMLGGVFIGIPLVALVVALALLGRPMEKQKWLASGLLAISVLFSTIGILPLLLILTMFIGTSPNLHMDAVGAPFQVAIFIETLIFILTVNTILVVNRRFKHLSFFEHVVVSGMGIIILLMVTGSAAYIPKRVMNVYQFGYIPASLVLSDVGCMVLDNHNIPSFPHKNTCRVSEVTIHSRLGRTYYVQVNASDSSPVCLTIPSEHVLSWAISRPKEGTIWPPKGCI